MSKTHDKSGQSDPQEAPRPGAEGQDSPKDQPDARRDQQDTQGALVDRPLSSDTVASSAAEPQIAIEVHDLTVSYHARPVLWDIDFALPEGHLMAIIGPNGAGKTTLLKSMLGLLPLSSGWVEIFGKSYKEMRLKVGYVPQRESVDWDFPTTALDVVTMGRYGRLGWFRRPRREDWDMARRCLEKVGMESFAERQISQLSGGQQQRVFLARALAQEADLYLMDEPFAGVDAVTEKAIVELLQELRAQNKTVVVVHHDLQTVPEYFDWALLINMRLVAMGPIEEVFTEENLKKTYGGQLAILSQAAEAVAHGKRWGR